MSTAAILVAAGRGERMNDGPGQPPKQLRPLMGKPVLAWSLEFFDRLEAVDLLCLVTRPELREAIETSGVTRRLTKPLVWAEGGARRQDSTRNGLLALPDEVNLAAVHDAVRPFPPKQAVLDAIEAARSEGGAIVALRMTDTVKRDNGEGRISETVDRSDLWLAQTPQAFQRALLMEAFERADAAGAELTDEASALEFMGRKPALIAGSAFNIKITTREDLLRAEAYARILGNC